MSATPATLVRPDIRDGASAFSRAFSACWYAIALYFARRAAIKSLRELDDRALWDIGLLRCQIEPAVNGFMTAPDRGRM